MILLETSDLMLCDIQFLNAHEVHIYISNQMTPRTVNH